MILEQATLSQKNYCIWLLGYMADYLMMIEHDISSIREGKKPGFNFEYLQEKFQPMKRHINNIGHDKFWDTLSQISQKELEDYFSPQ